MNFLSFWHRIVAQNADLAFRWFKEACKNPDQRGLSGTVRPNQPGHLPPPDICFYSVQSKPPFGRKSLNKAVDVYQPHGYRHTLAQISVWMRNHNAKTENQVCSQLTRLDGLRRKFGNRRYKS